jgi:hypothetical protein
MYKYKYIYIIYITILHFSVTSNSGICQGAGPEAAGAARYLDVATKALETEQVHKVLDSVQGNYCNVLLGQKF